LLQRLKTGRWIPNPPQTIGVKTETLKINNIEFAAWDLGGQLHFRRALWDMYTKDSVGLVFVIDPLIHYF